MRTAPVPEAHPYGEESPLPGGLVCLLRPVLLNLCLQLRVSFQGHMAPDLFCIELIGFLVIPLWLTAFSTLEADAQHGSRCCHFKQPYFSFSCKVLLFSQIYSSIFQLCRKV